MKRLILLFGLLTSLGFPPESLRAQSVKKRLDGWVDVLRNDPRLKIAVNFKFASRPSADEVLDTLQKATGVRLSLVAQATEGKLTFGSTTAVNVPAWKVMEQLAATQVADGKWEKAGDAYVLHGKPKAFGLAAEASSTTTKMDKKTLEVAKARAAKTQNDFARLHPLGLDPKLRAKLTVVEKQPKLSEMLDRLRACTDLKFTLAENLTFHDPEFGELALPTVAAYSIMEIIAERDLDDGRWEKTDQGYMLVGYSRALKIPPPQFPVAWVGFGIGLLLASGGGCYLLRKRRLATQG